MKRRLVAATGLFMIAVVGGMPFVVANFVKAYVERSLELELQGSLVPSFLQPSFTLKDTRFQWEDKVKLESGDLWVQYRFFPVLLGKPLRLHIRGNDLKVILLSDWASMFQATAIPIKEFDLDLSLDQEGIHEIHDL